MMSHRLLLTVLLAWVFSLAPGVRAADENGSPAGDGSFKPTTTHIVADPWRFLKIERPEPMGPREPAPRPLKGEEPRLMTDYVVPGIFVLTERRDREERIAQQHIGWGELPFFSSEHYLFAVYDEKVNYNYKKQNAFGNNVSFSRTALLDVPFFTGYYMKFEAPQRVHWEAARLPLITTLAHTTDHNSEKWKFLNIPLIWGLRYEQNGANLEVNVLDVPLASLYYRHVCADEKNDFWTFVDLPFFDLMRSETVDKKSTFTFFDGPLCYMFRTQDHKDVHLTKVLRLPILGPVFAYRTDAKGRKMGVLPSWFAPGMTKEE